MSDERQALVFSRFGDDLPQSARWSALGGRTIDAGAEQRVVACEFLVYCAPAIDERSLLYINGVATKWITGSRVIVIRDPNHKSDYSWNCPRNHGNRPKYEPMPGATSGKSIF